MIRSRASIVRRTLACRRGSAAVEMALVAPMLLALMFGAADLGNYFLSEHAVVNGVRDGARYASRSYPLACTAVSNDTGTVATATKYLVRTNSVDGTGDARLYGWTDNATVTVSITCNTSSTYAGGIYSGSSTGIPVVTVSATVPYTSLFKTFGLTTTTINLNASAQAAVVGA